MLFERIIEHTACGEK